MSDGPGRDQSLNDVPAESDAAPDVPPAAPAEPAPAVTSGDERGASRASGDAPAPAAESWPRVERRRPGRAQRTALLLLVLAGAAFATGMALFNGLVMPQLIHGRGEVRVPDLASLSVEEAEQSLRQLGLKLSRSGERFDPAVPRGLVLQQDPPAQSAVRAGRRVLVVVSLGEEFSSVPQLFGISLRGARILIERTGLAVGGVTRAPSEDVGEGLVVATDPPAESVLPREAPVGLLVSTGSAAESFVMPELLGRDLPTVRRQLEALGFRVLSPEGAGARGMIIVQQPAPGTHVDRGTVVTLQGNGRSSS
jgi:eukaryotic-like serine/threonine-protein kinase